ncbi:unnamed protein product [Sphacelaria rigidula]
MARPAIVVGVLGVLAAGAHALRVTQPSLGTIVGGNSRYTVEWIDVSSDARFDIDLTYCGSSYSLCFEDEEDCGTLVEGLCMEGEMGCASDPDLGGYEVLMPEPLDGVSSNGYRVRISQIGLDEERVRCSDDFYLKASGDSVSQSMSVVTPTADSIAIAGNEYTIEFDYDDGYGGTAARFRIDLYAVVSDDGVTSDIGVEGDCGVWMGSICDKPEIGCRDTTGNYDVVIPSDTEPGLYKVRVGLFGDDSVYDCSDTFEVMEMGEDLWG